MKRFMLVLLVLLLVGSACAGGDDSGDSSASSGADMEAASQPEFAGNEDRLSDEGRAGDSGGSTASGGAGLSYDSASEEVAAADTTAGSYGAGGGSDGDQPAARDLIALPADQKVIKTADIEVEVAKDEVDDAVQDAIALAERHGGFVLSTTLDEDKRSNAAIAIRVPSEEFEAALGGLKDVGKLLSETVQGRDVSEEFVDLKARLRNLQAQEVVLLRLYDRAQTVVDTIRIQREVQDVQLEIERHRGRLRFLEDRTSLSTIGIRFTEVGATPPKKETPKGAIARAWEQAKDLALGVVSGVIVATGFVVPVGLLLLAAFLLFRAFRPRFEAHT